MPFYETILACPACHGEINKKSKNIYLCNKCDEKYPIIDDIPVFTISMNSTGNDSEKKKAQMFWNEGWKKRFQNGDFHQVSSMKRESLERHIRGVIQKLIIQRHHIVCEMSPEMVRGKTVLDIGCGGGLQAPIFTFYGADYIGLDLSYNASMQSYGYIKILGGGGITAEANAERLPIKDSSVDFVYSHGVLHHTPNTQVTFDEVLRVLKPKGQALIGLYVTLSPKFIVDRLYGKIKVFLKKQKNWFSSGEGAWHSENRSNPWTKTYTKSELICMLDKDKYSDLEIRKFSFKWGNTLPGFGKYIDMSKIGTRLGYAISPYLGDIWSIHFRKK